MEALVLKEHIGFHLCLTAAFFTSHIIYDAAAVTVKHMNDVL